MAHVKAVDGEDSVWKAEMERQHVKKWRIMSASVENEHTLRHYVCLRVVPKDVLNCYAPLKVNGVESNAKAVQRSTSSIVLDERHGYQKRSTQS
ncbi:hypothetical protein ANCCAN_16028 [Ancylostoma caninum]|uniref:Uncharacterized protein n=1 Tax=Ancylostoma caninum TaxID=29170 RepID=A0A368G0T6_ANCCA|nr:hypothetical protein ANCCAN_16028 [Ancylostoma caninum]